MTMMDVLNQIGEGKITVENGIEMIRQMTNTETEMVPVENQNHAKWIKVKIFDAEDNTRINLPPIPIGLVGSLAAWGMKMGIKHSEEETLRKIDPKDVKKILMTLKHLPPINLVSVKDEKGTEVEIYTR
ncbi:MAG: hypothetical protein JXQ26_09500 [Tissierellales bacterium]|nr:hypothetical protein [Tissierellales bacterium]MBN2828215.1 hypothetical protein [Tissierellales bacterium]